MTMILLNRRRSCRVVSAKSPKSFRYHSDVYLVSLPVGGGKRRSSKQQQKRQEHIASQRV